MARIYENLTALIGHTPLVELKQIEIVRIFAVENPPIYHELI